jgi:hypothetical protein
MNGGYEMMVAAQVGQESVKRKGKQSKAKHLIVVFSWLAVGSQYNTVTYSLSISYMIE